MSGRVSRRGILAALIRREILIYSRDKLYLLLTGLLLILVVGVFWVAPDEVDDRLTLAVSPPLEKLFSEETVGLRGRDLPGDSHDAFGASIPGWEEGVRVLELSSEGELRAVLQEELVAWLGEDGTLILREAGITEARPECAEQVRPTVGIAFPEGFVSLLAAGNSDVVVTLYAHASVPLAIRNALRSFVREAAYQLSGSAPPVTFPTEETIILGPDRAGDQVALRARLIPMIAFMILLMETLALSSLISKEVLQRTVTAVLVTPARVSDFLLSKTIFGTGLAMTQSVIVLALVGAFTGHTWLMLLVCVLVAALMFTGVSMVVGAAGKDFIGQLFYLMLITVPLLIPAFAVLFPGSTAAWVRMLPTYFVLDALQSVTVYQDGWNDILPSLGIASGWVLALYGTGLFVLRRKVVSL